MRAHVYNVFIMYTECTYNKNGLFISKQCDCNIWYRLNVFVDLILQKHVNRYY